MINTKIPKVAFVCPTFRDEEKSDGIGYKVRHAGVVALYHQFTAQNYPQDSVELRIIDSSAKPHPFFEQLQDERVKYINIPDRRNPSPDILERHPEIKEFLLDDATLSAPKWRQRIKALQNYCSRRIDPNTGQQVPSMTDPLESERMPIGMMRNMGSCLDFRDGSTGKADILISTDDDDWRSKNYTQLVVDALKDADWMKLTSYYLNIFPNGDPNKAVWGVMNPEPVGFNQKGDIEFNMQGEAVRYDPAAAPDSIALEFASAKEILTSPRWPLSSSDGCVHAVRYEAWRRSADIVGGFTPVSNAEDHLFYASLKMLGNLDNPESKIFHDRIAPCILGTTPLDKHVISADKEKGELRFNPVTVLTTDFVRFGGANTSKLVMSACELPLNHIPNQIHHCFDFFAQALSDKPESKISPTARQSLPKQNKQALNIA
jgi:hypothetical protein